MSDTVNQYPWTRGNAPMERRARRRFERDDITAGPVLLVLGALVVVTALTFVGVLV